MRQFEIEKPSKKAIFEGLNSDKEHTFKEDTLKEIAESVSKFDESSPSMSVDECIDWINNL